jgi:hypothetical protein
MQVCLGSIPNEMNFEPLDRWLAGLDQLRRLADAVVQLSPGGVASADPENG